MEKNNKTLNVPHLRFPEFSGEWEKTSIGECFSKVENGLTYDTDNTRGVPVTRIETISDKSINYDRVGYANIDDKISKYEMQYGDVLFSHINSLKHIGKTAFYDAAQPLYHGMNLLLLRAKKSLDSKFLYYTLNTHKFLHRCQVLANQAVNQASINTKELKSINISVPQMQEQQKISGLISLLDERIKTQKKIIEKYESLIRGLCEKLTRQGTPNKIIAECLKCHSTSLQESAVLDAGSYPVYGAIGICGYTDTPDVSGDGILIIKDGASVGVTYFADGTYSFIGTLNRLTANEDINLRYVYYCLKVLNFTPYKTGLAIPHIYFKDYGKHKIWCPPLEQQSKIADALTTIENKIQVEKSLLAHLNSQKQYMLNQLFI